LNERQKYVMQGDSEADITQFLNKTREEVDFGYQKPAAGYQKPATTTPKTASLSIVKTVSFPTVLAETSTATKPAAMPKPAIPDVKDKTLKVGASTVAAETSTAAKPKPAAKLAIPDVKGTKLNVGDWVRVKATGQEGVLWAKAWVRLDEDEKNTQFKHADLERID
jgi:hypothetical protein